MYSIEESVSRIKELAKEKGVSISKLLSDIGVAKNTLLAATTRGSWGNAESLIRIAEYFSCSVDYLIGRTDNPEINQGPSIINSDNVALNSAGAVVNSYNNSFSDSLEAEFVGNFKKLELPDKLEVLSDIVRRVQK